MLAIAVGAGTSPLYVFPNVFASQPSSEDVVGAMSLIFWTLTLIVVVKYTLIVLRFNDNGEGGCGATVRNPLSLPMLVSLACPLSWGARAAMKRGCWPFAKHKLWIMLLQGEGLTRC